MIQEIDTARALGIADMKTARRDVQIATGAGKPPGAKLDVLTVGVSRRRFVDRDAQEVASALLNTREGRLYAEVKPIFLHDSTADKGGNFQGARLHGPQHGSQHHS